MADRITMNVSMSPQHESFVKGLVSAGRFRNNSEVVRAGLRLLEEQARQHRLEEMLVDGLKSGGPCVMDDGYWSEIGDRVARRLNQDGSSGQ